MKLTTTLTDDAAAFLRAKLKGKRLGAGAILSSLLMQEKGREEAQRQTQEIPLTTNLVVATQEPPIGAWQGPSFAKIRRHHER